MHASQTQLFPQASPCLLQLWVPSSCCRCPLGWCRQGRWTKAAASNACHDAGCVWFQGVPAEERAARYVGYEGGQHEHPKVLFVWQRDIVGVAHHSKDCFDGALMMLLRVHQPQHHQSWWLDNCDPFVLSFIQVREARLAGRSLAEQIQQGHLPGMDCGPPPERALVCYDDL